VEHEDVANTCLDLLTLCLLPGVGPRTVRELARRGPLATGVLARPEDHADLLPEPARRLIASGAGARRARDEADAAARLGFSLVGQDDADYPALLRYSFDPPPVLYVKGKVPSFSEPSAVALVGSRSASAKGRALARGMAAELAAAGFVVVSGLARGVDTAAHEGALQAKGTTVAVLGSALDRLYPPENAGLAERIAASGPVISEFPLGTAPLPGHFPRRNRVIAALSRGTVVVEAAARSGALITARFALEEGREVMAVPGHPGDRGAEGTNALIRDGAALVRAAADVAFELGVTLPGEGTLDGPVGGGLLGALRLDHPLSLDELCARIGRPAPELLAELGLLEVEARVKRLAGGLYLRISPERV
jgi:DNA processing protein